MKNRHNTSSDKKCNACKKAGSTLCNLSCNIKRISYKKWFKQFPQPKNFNFPKEYTGEE